MVRLSQTQKSKFLLVNKTWISCYVRKGILIIIISLFFVCSLLPAAEIRFDFNNDQDVQYNNTAMEIYNGNLSLSEFGVWTNTPGFISSYYSLPTYLFQNTDHSFYYGCTEMGPWSLTYLSTNYGTTWTNVFPDNLSKMVRSWDGTLYAGGGGCCGDFLMKSFDNGKTWNSINPSAASGTTTVFEDNRHAQYILKYKYSVFPTSWTSNNIWKSVNGGTNWSMIFTQNWGTCCGGNNLFQSFYQLSNSHILVCMTTNVYVSTNFGTNWSLFSPMPEGKFAGMFKSRDNNIYAFGDNGIVRSPDEGSMWQWVTSEKCQGLLETGDGQFIRVYWTNIYRSRDRGQTWTLLPGLIKDGKNYSYLQNGRALIQADDGKVYIGGCVAEQDGYLFRNGYAGSSQAFLSLAPEKVNRWQGFTRSEELNGGQISYDFVYSSDQGVTWSAYQTLTDLNLRKTVCIGNGDDRLKICITLASSNHSASPVVEWLAVQYDGSSVQDLTRVYAGPNPLRPGKTGNDQVVFYNLTSDFEIKVYTTTGFEIAAVKGTSTNGTFAWSLKQKNGKEMKAGVYLCRITNANGQEKELKLVIIR